MSSCTRLCLESLTPRPVQQAMIGLLRAISEEAPSLPIIIVGTKADILLKVHDRSSEIRAEKEKMFRQEFENNRETKVFWDELNTNFTFVSYGTSGPLIIGSQHLRPHTG